MFFPQKPVASGYRFVSGYLYHLLLHQALSDAHFDLCRWFLCMIVVLSRIICITGQEQIRIRCEECSNIFVDL